MKAETNFLSAVHPPTVYWVGETLAHQVITVSVATLKVSKCGRLGWNWAGSLSPMLSLPLVRLGVQDPGEHLLEVPTWTSLCLLGSFITALGLERFMQSSVGPHMGSG